MNAPKFMSLEELIADHERLSSEVDELKRAFGGHRHYTNDGSVPMRGYPDYSEHKTSEPMK